MCSATSRLPRPEAPERHKHRALVVSPSTSSIRLPTKPETAITLNDRGSGKKEPRPGVDAEPDNSISGLSNEKLPPPLSTPLRPSTPSIREDADQIEKNVNRAGESDWVIQCAKDLPCHGTGDYCTLDIEKQSERSYGGHSEEGHGLPRSYPDTAAMNNGDESTEGERDIDKHLKSILLHLSMVSPFLTIILSIYAFVSLVVLLSIYPLRYCTSRKPLNQQIFQALHPQIRWQLRLIHSSCPTSLLAHTCMVIFICIFSPIYAVGIAAASWVAAVFWFYSAILGEPQEASRPDNDGRAAVLGVRKMWERWLVKGASI